MLGFGLGKPRGAIGIHALANLTDCCLVSALAENIWLSIPGGNRVYHRILDGTPRKSM